MNGTTLFDWAGDALERASSLSRLESRGRLRVTLQNAGLDPKSLTERQLAGVLRATLPDDLARSGVRDAARVCQQMLEELPGGGTDPASPPAAAAQAAPLAGDPGHPSLFEWLADAFERETTLARLQARGTLRLALKEAGLDAEDLTKPQASAVLVQLMPRYLRSRGVTEADAACAAILAELPAARVLAPAFQGESPEEVFRRLGSREPLARREDRVSGGAP